MEIARQDGTALPEPLAGRTFNGKLLLRTTPENHRLLALRALEAGESLNAFVVKTLVGSAGARQRRKK